MARFRHIYASDEKGLDFDWRAHPHFPDHYLANLENGDWLGVGPELPGPNQDQSWSYGVYGPLPGHLDKHNLPYDYEKGHFVQHGAGDDPPPPGYKTGDEDWVLGGAPARFRRRGWPYHGASSPQEAMRNAEQHYHTLNRRNVTPPSTRDYDINDIMRRFDNGEL